MEFQGDQPTRERVVRSILVDGPSTAVALADRLDGDGARSVRAAVDVTTAELYLRTGDRAEARRRAERCGADLGELLPGLLGDREYVLGALADEEGRGARRARRRRGRRRSVLVAEED